MLRNLVRGRIFQKHNVVSMSKENFEVMPLIAKH